MPVPEYTGEYTLKAGEGFDVSTINGKSVVITGGASGIGKEIVKAFISAGASFVTIGDLQESGQQLADELGDRVAFVKTDVTKWADQVNLFQTALIRSPSHLIDTVISNAGISGRDSLYWDDSEQDGEPIEPTLKVLNTNLVGCIYTCKLALHYLTRQPNPEKHDRCLILMSSIAGYCDQPGTPIYCASKHGIRGIMSSLRRTAHKQDVRVNLLAPWYVRTPAIPAENQDRLSSQGVVWAETADAAAASMHLASDPLLNGRCVAIVPRHEDPRGYMDMQKDDFSDDLACTWQRIMVAASHRA
ncbi:uncharacterized protein N7484_007590 [Penicillium longicatenatum]|uniref:uncharacterized protein n=1 Tax=Penicillium longicatenatum TaxID=1561947 RepID=UPI00254983B4|nr:uncharacterized protein N7484_007590 [Penicillium longicatenatum]KAJ5639728.1 hypothetical protein N7484_007590 [Penicillium longicatenatum]